MDRGGRPGLPTTSTATAGARTSSPTTPPSISRPSCGRLGDYEHDQIFAKSKDDEMSTKTVSMDTICFFRITDLPFQMAWCVSLGPRPHLTLPSPPPPMRPRPARVVSRDVGRISGRSLRPACITRACGWDGRVISAVRVHPEPPAPPSPKSHDFPKNL